MAAQRGLEKHPTGIESPPIAETAAMEPTGVVERPTLAIQNVVSTFYLGCKDLNLKQIASRLKFLEFNPHKFAASTLRLTNPRTTALVFGSGNVVCTGAKTASKSRLACRMVVNIFQKCGLPVGFSNFRIQNIVASVAGLEFPIKLRELNNDYAAYTSYENSLFPGLIFRLRSPKIVFLLFRSGRLVVTGAKTEEEIVRYWNAFFDLVLINYIDVKDGLRCSSEYRQRNETNEYSMNYFYEALK